MYQKHNKFKLAGIFTFLFLFMAVIKTDSVKAAEKLELNKNYTVELKNDSDSHLYEFTVSAAGNISIQVKNADPVGSQKAAVQLYDSNNLPLTKQQTGSNIELPVYSTDADKTFYIKLDGWLSINNTSYHLFIGYEPTTDWETEKNDTAAEADIITPGRSWYGTITESNDTCDYFKFNLDSAKKVSITFGPKEVSGESHRWEVSLINENSRPVKIYDDSVTRTYTCYLKKGDYYLKVENYLSAENVPYAVSFKDISIKLEKPVITSISAVGHNGIFSNYVELDKIKFKNTKDASGYVIKVSNKKNMEKPFITEDIHFDEMNTKRQVSLKTDFKVAKAYYVQAKSYVEDPFGEKIYGKYGSIKGKTLKKSVYNKLK